MSHHEWFANRQKYIDQLEKYSGENNHISSLVKNYKKIIKEDFPCHSMMVDFDYIVDTISISSKDKNILSIISRFKD